MEEWQSLAYSTGFENQRGKPPWVQILPLPPFIRKEKSMSLWLKIPLIIICFELFIFILGIGNFEGDWKVTCGGMLAVNGAIIFILSIFGIPIMILKLISL